MRVEGKLLRSSNNFSMSIQSKLCTQECDMMLRGPAQTDASSCLTFCRVEKHIATWWHVPQICWGTLFGERVPQCSCSPDDFGEHGNKVPVPRTFREHGNNAPIPQTILGNMGTMFLFPKHFWGTREQCSCSPKTFEEQGHSVPVPQMGFRNNLGNVFPKWRCVPQTTVVK